MDSLKKSYWYAYLLKIRVYIWQLFLPHYFMYIVDYFISNAPKIWNLSLYCSKSYYLLIWIYFWLHFHIQKEMMEIYMNKQKYIFVFWVHVSTLTGMQRPVWSSYFNYYETWCYHFLYVLLLIIFCIIVVPNFWNVIEKWYSSVIYFNNATFKCYIDKTNYILYGHLANFA